MLEEDSAEEQAGGGASAAAGDESGGDTRVVVETRGDTTESSGGGADVGGDDGGDDDATRTATSPVPAAGSDSDSAAYRDEDLERDVPPPVSSSRGKSSEPGVAGQADDVVRMVVDLSTGSEPDSEGSSSVPASQPAPSPRRTKALEAEARKKKDAALPPLFLRERRSKSAADADAGAVRRKRRGEFKRQSVLPAKKLASPPSRPTTAGLTPAGKPTAEERADAIVADAWAEVDARTAKETGVPAGGTDDEVIGHVLGGDFIYDLNPSELEKEFYARSAQEIGRASCRERVYVLV